MDMGHHSSNQWQLSRIEACYYSGFLFAFAFLHEGYKPVELADLGFLKPAIKRATAVLLERSRPADTLSGVGSSDLVVQHVLLSMGFGARELRRARLSESSRDARDSAMCCDRRKKLSRRRNPNAPHASRGRNALASSVGMLRSRVGPRQRQQSHASRRSVKCNLIAEAKRQQREHNCRSG